jgi:hypothetical protein
MLGVPQRSVQASHGQQQEHLIPRSHRFQAQISLSKRQRSPPSVKTTMGRQHLQGTQQSRRISKWLFDERVWHVGNQSTSLSIADTSVKRHRCQTSTGGCRHTAPHTHLAHLIPNQHTPTCRSINDLVLKQPAYPQMEDILGSYPFLSPMERAYLGLCNTTRYQAETLFLDSFTTISPLCMEQAYLGLCDTQVSSRDSVPRLIHYNIPHGNKCTSGLCNTTRCEAETLFLDSFTMISPME